MFPHIRFAITGRRRRRVQGGARAAGCAGLLRPLARWARALPSLALLLAQPSWQLPAAAANDQHTSHTRWQVIAAVMHLVDNQTDYTTNASNVSCCSPARQLLNLMSCSFAMTKLVIQTTACFNLGFISDGSIVSCHVCYQRISIPAYAVMSPVKPFA